MTIDLRLNYSDLRKINVNPHTEKKGKLTYLSWAWAVHYLLEDDPSANWEYGEPRMFGETMMVFCSVTAFGKTMTAQLPVLDYNNKPIKNPDAMSVNTAMQRSLAKAIALHGIGLYIYGGEDLPITDTFEGSNPTPHEEADDIPQFTNAEERLIDSSTKEINASPDFESLKSVYYAAIAAAEGNQEILKIILRAKNIRYREILGVTEGVAQ